MAFLVTECQGSWGDSKCPLESMAMWNTCFPNAWLSIPQLWVLHIFHDLSRCWKVKGTFSNVLNRPVLDLTISPSKRGDLPLTRRVVMVIYCSYLGFVSEKSWVRDFKVTSAWSSSRQTGTGPCTVKVPGALLTEGCWRVLARLVAVRRRGLSRGQGKVAFIRAVACII